MKLRPSTTFIIVTLALGLGAVSRTQASDTAPIWGQWSSWGDQGDGTYRNPVLPADYSDLDCIRVGDAYYAIASTMQFSPGMAVLHSRDLVNWTLIGHAISDLKQIGPALNWDRMDRAGRGVWAGSIRYHDSKFHVFFGTPDEGFFVTTAAHPAGPWSPLHPLLSEPGWDDCSALWDHDGQAYFVGTRFSDGTRHLYHTYVFPLSADGRRIDRANAVLVNEGSGREASKLLKIDGWYYLLFSEQVAGQGRHVLAKRARHPLGPYSNARQLSHPDREAGQPNQGGLVQTPQGDWYFFTHHGTGAWEGRAASLTPVTWVDGWPVLGRPDAAGIGHFVWSGKIPALPSTVSTPQTSDDFERPELAPQWEWHYQPRAEKWSLTARPGWLRLQAFPPLAPDALLQAGNTLTQRSFRSAASEVVVKLDLSGFADGQKAGLCHFARTHAALGVSQTAGVRRLEFRLNGAIQEGPALEQPSLWLKSTWGLDGRSQFAYSLDGQTFTDFGAPYPLTWGHYRGDRIGLYCYNNQSEAGHLDVDTLSYLLRRN